MRKPIRKSKRALKRINSGGRYAPKIPKQMGRIGGIFPHTQR